MGNYRIGLDIGIASVGWAVLDLLDNGDPYRIRARGVRVFQAAERPKDGKSLAADRREKRSLRRQCRRKRLRKEMVRKLLMQEMKIDAETIDGFFHGELMSIYQIRAEALDRALSQVEWARLLIFWMQHRGYRATVSVLDGDDGVMKSAAQANHALYEQGMAIGKYRTVGEMIWNEKIDRAVDENGVIREVYRVRNKGGVYENTYLRADIEDEIKTVFAAQHTHGNSYASAGMETTYLQIFTAQRSFDKGPGGNSPYGAAPGHTIFESLIGKCSVYPSEMRGVKASLTYERFTALQAINHLSVSDYGKKRGLTSEERELLCARAFDSKEFTYGQVRKLLRLGEQVVFCGLNYSQRKTKSKKGKDTEYCSREEVEKKRFVKCPFSYALGKVYGDYAFTTEEADELGYAASVFKTDDGRKDYLRAKGFDESVCERAVLLDQFRGVGNLSLRAMREMIPYLEQGNVYSDAYGKAFGTQSAVMLRGKKLRFNDFADEITNPVVRRSVSQTVKVVNAIIDRYGSPQTVHIELARELAKNFDERNKAAKRIEENRVENERIYRHLQELKGSLPTGAEIVKYKLWVEQQGICAYSLRPIPLEAIFDRDMVEVDHIIPYSRCFDDRYTNKVLVYTEENRNKTNCTPLEYMTEEQANHFIVWVKNNISNRAKRERLLTQTFDEDGMIQRNLVDTQYIATLLAEIFRTRLEFAPSEAKNKVVTVNGSVTNYLRKRYGMGEKDRSIDTHHAVDAILIAVCSQRLINLISKYEKFNRSYYYDRNSGKYLHYKTKQEFDNFKELQAFVRDNRCVFPPPWENFRKEVEMWMSPAPDSEAWRSFRRTSLLGYDDEESVEPLFVSRMQTHKVSGAGHKETIRSSRMVDGQRCYVNRVTLDKLKLDKDGEIAQYYRPQDDRQLYEMLRERLRAGQPFKQEEVVYKPMANGGQGAPVKRVKVYEAYSLGVTLPKTGGVAGNGGMVRIDVFSDEKKGRIHYYYVPVYTADFYAETFPNRAATAGKEFDEWREMTDAYKFEFSLYPNDLFYAKSDKGFPVSCKKGETTEKVLMRDIVGYYTSAGISTASISFRLHDKSGEGVNMGIKGLREFRKLEVDVLGNVKDAPKETRNTNMLRGKR